jgi:hypothetical protein
LITEEDILLVENGWQTLNWLRQKAGMPSYPSRRSNMPKKYTIVPITVEAIELTPETVDRVVHWTGGVAVTEIDPEDSSKKFVAVNIPTKNGVERAQTGEVIVKGPRGDFSKITREEFEQFLIPVRNS